mmetsp:Transcript_40872/g.87029  ORF Transcript_40872/g.87029 Transcript_40872/m.87029 type:complete len:215 (+) Transcript_40872:325-969(+)
MAISDLYLRLRLRFREYLHLRLRLRFHDCLHFRLRLHPRFHDYLQLRLRFRDYLRLRFSLRLRLHLHRRRCLRFHHEIAAQRRTGHLGPERHGELLKQRCSPLAPLGLWHRTLLGRPGTVTRRSRLVLQLFWHCPSWPALHVDLGGGLALNLRKGLGPGQSLCAEGAENGKHWLRVGGAVQAQHRLPTWGTTSGSQVLHLPSIQGRHKGRCLGA